MRRVFSVWVLSLVCLLTFASLGLAQKKDQESTTRSVQGIVTNPGGVPVEGAIVHLENTKTLQVRSYITKPNGTYAFYGLNTNVDYQLKAEHQGAASDVKTLSVFDSRSKAVINLKLNKK